jgi:hypothetical protein
MKVYCVVWWVEPIQDEWRPSSLGCWMSERDAENAAASFFDGAKAPGVIKTRIVDVQFHDAEVDKPVA